MRTNGRISAAQAASVTAMPLYKPDPPRGLTVGQAEEWRAVVARMPHNWFGQETHAMLTQHCRQVERLRFIAGQLNRMQDNEETDEAAYHRLVNLELQATKVLALIDAKMRLCQQTSQDKKGHRPVEVAKPWE